MVQSGNLSTDRDVNFAKIDVQKFMSTNDAASSLNLFTLLMHLKMQFKSYAQDIELIRIKGG